MCYCIQCAYCFECYIYVGRQDELCRAKGNFLMDIGLKMKPKMILIVLKGSKCFRWRNGGTNIARNTYAAQKIQARSFIPLRSRMRDWKPVTKDEMYMMWSNRSETGFLLGCGYTSGHPCLQGAVLELTLSVGQGMVPERLCPLWTSVEESCTSALFFVPCGMSEEQHQRVCVKFYAKLGRNGGETFGMLRTAFD